MTQLPHCHPRLNSEIKKWVEAFSNQPVKKQNWAGYNVIQRANQRRDINWVQQRTSSRN